MDVAIEDRSDDASLAVDEWRARVAADDVVVGRYIEQCLGIDAVLGRHPALRQPERLAVGGPLVQTAEFGERGHGLPLVGPALDAPERESQCEGCVRVDGVAIDLEPCAGKLLLTARDRSFNFLLVARAQRP